MPEIVCACVRLYVQAKSQNDRDRFRVGTAINRFMIQHDAYYTRRGQTFPTDILVNLPNMKDTLKARRNLNGHGSSYYELWRARGRLTLVTSITCWLH